MTSSRMLPPRPFIDHPFASVGPPARRKLPEIPKSAKLQVIRPTIPPEPHYPSSFHSSFDEGKPSQL